MFGLHYVSPSPPLSLSLRINILHVGESFFFFLLLSPVLQAERGFL